MDKRFLFCCISITVCGIALFLSSVFLIKETNQLFGWCLGLGAALIVLGLGFLIRFFFDQIYIKNNACLQGEGSDSSIRKSKEKAGYLVCKIMMVLLCIHILIIKKMEPDPIILFLAIALVSIQYLMDLILQLYFINHK